MNLKGCPFCGNKPFITEIAPHTHVLAQFMANYYGGAFIECATCSAALSAATKEKVVELWNTRATEMPDRTSFNSSREAYTYILEEHEWVKQCLERTTLDLSFLWMNITKGHFEKESERAHALKELDYLVGSSRNLADAAIKLSNLAKSLITHIVEEANGLAE